MKIKVLGELGYTWAMLGLSLSYNQPVENMPEVALKLLKRGGSHTKYLESISVWLDITAPRYWWQQFDAYRVGVTKQSESTMHTILRRPLERGDFERPLAGAILDHLNRLIVMERFGQLKNDLPEGFLQRRINKTNYQALRRMIWQRRKGELYEWKVFIDAVLDQVEHPGLLR